MKIPALTIMALYTNSARYSLKYAGVLIDTVSESIQRREWNSQR